METNQYLSAPTNFPPKPSSHNGNDLADRPTPTPPELTASLSTDGYSRPVPPMGRLTRSTENLVFPRYSVLCTYDYLLVHIRVSIDAKERVDVGFIYEYK